MTLNTRIAMNKLEKRDANIKEALRLYYEQNLSTSEISKTLNVREETISFWISIFANGTRSLKEYFHMIPSRNSSKKEDIQESSPKASCKSEEDQSPKIARLERELREARLRADFYDEMINVAESRFKISIRKKPGAKR